MAGQETLTIVTCPVPAGKFSEMGLRDGPVLATTIEAIHAMERQGISCLVVDDLFEVSSYLEEVDQGFAVVEEAFRTIDDRYGEVVGYPRAFTGYIYPFYAIYCYLKYADMIVRMISAKGYEKIRLISPYRDEEMGGADPGLHRLINRSSRCRELFLVQLLASGLRAETVQLNGSAEPLPQIQVSRFQEKWFSIQYEGLVSFIKRQIRKGLPATFSNPKSVSALFVQGGYEADELARLMGDLNVVLPLAPDDPAAEAPDPIPKHYLAAQDALAKCCGRFLPVFLEVLSHYHEQEIPKINPYVRAVEKQLAERRPAFALYSAGANTLYEDIYAHLLNSFGIDIYYFQHSGTETYFRYPAFEKYVACNENIRKNLMVSTQLDKKLKEHYQNTTIAVIGHNKGNNIYRYYRRKHRKNKKALFLAAWYPSDHLLGARCDDSDLVSYRKHVELFEVLRRHNVSLDVKLFPDKRHARYYRDLLDRCGLTDAGLILSPRAEYLIPRYSLIIAETVTSTLSTFLMCVDTPVIYYMRMRTYIHPAVYDDFLLRNHVATNEVELGKYIADFADGTLKSNYADGFVDRYVTPLSLEQPSRYFAELIRRRQRVPER